MMLTYYPIDPVALRIGPIAIHWYGLMYIIGFALAWVVARFQAKRDPNWTLEQVSDLIFYSALGVLLGGRLGYILFYTPHEFLSVFRIWDGGMSFHGGFLGVAVSLALFAKHTQKTYYQVTDFVVPLVPIGLAAGRLGNFINGELWGRVTTVPWGMVFPHAPGDEPRHPSQLYELGLEGIALGLILYLYTRRSRPTGSTTGLFLLGYGVFRCFVECFREPDSQLGFLWGNWLTMGQLLSFPMIVFGVYLLYTRRRSKDRCSHILSF